MLDVDSEDEKEGRLIENGGSTIRLRATVIATTSNVIGVRFIHLFVVGTVVDISTSLCRRID